MIGGILLASDFMQSVRETEGVIERNSYGKGSKLEDLEVTVQGKAEKIPIEVEIAERQYSSKEVLEVFDRIISRMDELILGENKSLDRIEQDMVLLTKIPDAPVEVSWELDRYDVLNVRGEIQQDNLKEEGTLVNLSAVLTYRENAEEQALYQCTVKVFPRTLDEDEKVRKRIEEEIQKQEKECRTSKLVKLPDKVLNREAVYYQKMDFRGLVLVIMAALIGVLLYALEIQKRGKEKEKKKGQMLLDYPEILNKMSLFLGAGMTAKRAWRKVVEDYERQKESWGERYA